MGQDVFLSLMKQALMTVLMLSAPALGVAIIVGLSVGLFQALTQIRIDLAPGGKAGGGAADHRVSGPGTGRASR